VGVEKRFRDLGRWGAGVVVSISWGLIFEQSKAVEEEERERTLEFDGLYVLSLGDRGVCVF
jgi:hypothetical protein